MRSALLASAGIRLLAAGASHVALNLQESFRLTPTAVRREATDVTILRALRSTWLPQMKAAAARKGQRFRNELFVDVRRVTKTERNGLVQYRIGAGSSRYFDFAVTANRLDCRLPPHLTHESARTLRALWNTEPRDLADLPRLPAPAKVGVGVVVIDADDLLLSFRRTLAHHVAPRGWHFVGEGMIPRDLYASGDPWNATAFRGLREELGIRPKDVDSLEVTGLAVDAQRWQLVAAFVARIALTADQVAARIRMHPGRDCEVAAIRRRPVSSPYWTALLSKRPGRQTSLASNHAVFVLACALRHLGSL